MGVVPDYILLDGQDPIAYILSANITRRHMTKGQRAMTVARICPEGGRGKTPSFLELSGERIRQARFILHHASDLADNVLAGSLSIDNAYAQARIRKGAAENYDTVFNRVKAKYPDLAELVIEERLGLEEAHVALRGRALGRSLRGARKLPL